MILAEKLLNTLKKNKISFFVGVPDSVLKKFLSHLKKINNTKNIISVNEGAAVSIGIGYYLSTKKIPCVYLQNSGLGNAINPLISIANKKVYSIPLLLMIGWRGSPGKKDEPQHMAKGKITVNLLKLMGIDYCILKNERDLKGLSKLIKNAYQNKKAVACLIENNILKSNKKFIAIRKKTNLPYRKDFIIHLLKQISNNTKIISTTGYTSRELAQIRSEEKLFKGEDFYMVGGMGHASMVSLGYSTNSKKQVICLDGDGSVLMHMGSMRTFGHLGNAKLKHILLNNNAHESVGGQPTSAGGMDFKKLVKSFGYKNYFKISKFEKMNSTLKSFLNSNGPSFLEVQINEGSINNLARPKNLIKVKNKFME